MATSIRDKTVEQRLTEVGQSLPIPTKREPLATSILRTVLTAQSLREIEDFVAHIRPEIAGRIDARESDQERPSAAA